VVSVNAGYVNYPVLTPGLWAFNHSTVILCLETLIAIRTPFAKAVNRFRTSLEEVACLCIERTQVKALEDFVNSPNGGIPSANV